MDMDDQDQNLTQRIKVFLAQDSEFRKPNFDPAPFLISILKQKQSDQQAILQRQKQLIDLQNQAFDLIDEVCAQHSDSFFRLLDVPQKQGAQLQKLKSNMSVVKKKVKQTKSLLTATQKDIEQLHLNCLYNKLVYKKLKQIELKLNQYESASLALKNNQFLACSMNIPKFKHDSVLQAALSNKCQNLQLRLLSRGIQQVTLFLYLTPKIVLPASQSLIDRVSTEQSFLGNLKKHDSFHKRYQLFKKAFCLDYLSTIWSFKNDLKKKSGKVHMVDDIINGILYIGNMEQVVLSLQLDCKKSINSIFILLLYFLSKQIEEEAQKSSKNVNKGDGNSYSSKKDNKDWFLTLSSKIHNNFVSVMMDIVGVILRKLSILRIIFKDRKVSFQSNKNLTSFRFFQLLLNEVNQIIDDIYIKQEDANFGFVKEGMMKIIKKNSNYIYWSSIKGMIVQSIVIIEENLNMIEHQQQLGGHNNVKWQEIVKIQDFDKKFYIKFHIDYLRTLEDIFCHEGKSFAFQPLQQIVSTKNIGKKQLNFCKFFTSEEMKYSKQYVFTIGFLEVTYSFFNANKFDQARRSKYILFILSVFYLKLNYYLQRFMINRKTLDKAYELRKINNKLKSKQKDILREHDKIYIKSKNQIVTKPWRRGADEEVEPSKYQMVQSLKCIQKQTQMLLSYYMKNMCDLQKYKSSQKVFSQIIIFEKLQPTNYDQNFHSKLIRIWDQLPQIEVSIMETTLALFQKLLELHITVVSVIYLQSTAN